MLFIGSFLSFSLFRFPGFLCKKIVYELVISALEMITSVVIKLNTYEMYARIKFYFKFFGDALATSLEHCSLQ